MLWLSSETSLSPSAGLGIIARRAASINKPNLTGLRIVPSDRGRPAEPIVAGTISVVGSIFTIASIDSDRASARSLGWRPRRATKSMAKMGASKIFCDAAVARMVSDMVPTTARQTSSVHSAAGQAWTSRSAASDAALPIDAAPAAVLAANPSVPYEDPSVNMGSMRPSMVSPAIPRASISVQRLAYPALSIPSAVHLSVFSM